MGVFSWKTQDTGRSIPATGNLENRPTFKVYMLDNNGNVWAEDAYEGYGEFGGKDFYELIAEMNGLGSNRTLGIDLAFSNKKYFSPNLVENINAWTWRAADPEICPDQGYFYAEDADDMGGWKNDYDDWDPEYVEDHKEDWVDYQENDDEEKDEYTT
jgi:hypothetical protein